MVISNFRLVERYLWKWMARDFGIVSVRWLWCVRTWMPQTSKSLFPPSPSQTASTKQTIKFKQPPPLTRVDASRCAHHHKSNLYQGRCNQSIKYKGCMIVIINLPRGHVDDSSLGQACFFNHFAAMQVNGFSETLSLEQPFFSTDFRQTAFLILPKPWVFCLSFEFFTLEF